MGKGARAAPAYFATAQKLQELVRQKEDIKMLKDVLKRIKALVKKHGDYKAKGMSYDDALKKVISEYK